MIYILCIRCNKASGTCADKIVSACTSESFQNKRTVLRLEVLEESALHSLILWSFGNINRFHSIGIKLCVVHAGGNSTGSRVEVLNLFRMYLIVTEIQCKAYGFIKGTSRM